MAIVTFKPGTETKIIAPGGMVLLHAIQAAADALATDLMITSGTDGAHSGPGDPHHRGEAYDLRTHDFSEDLKKALVDHIQQTAGAAFYVFLESPGTDNEHIHAQVRKGTKYPPQSDSEES